MPHPFLIDTPDITEPFGCHLTWLPTVYRLFHYSSDLFSRIRENKVDHTMFFVQIWRTTFHCFVSRCVIHLKIHLHHKQLQKLDNFDCYVSSSSCKFCRCQVGVTCLSLVCYISKLLNVVPGTKIQYNPLYFLATSKLVQPHPYTSDSTSGAHGVSVSGYVSHPKPLSMSSTRSLAWSSTGHLPPASVFMSPNPDPSTNQLLTSSTTNQTKAPNHHTIQHTTSTASVCVVVVCKSRLVQRWT